MRTEKLSSRVALGLISSTAVAAMLAPVASGATANGYIAAAPAPVAAPVAPALTKDYGPVVIVTRAPIGAALPGAPAPIVLVAQPTSTKGVVAIPFGKRNVLGESNRKEGYVNEQQWAWRGAGQGAAEQGQAGAAIGAVIGGIGGAVLGGIIGGALGTTIFPVAGTILGAIGGAIVVGVIGAGIGAAIGGGIGAAAGAVGGYNEGLANARWHNSAVKRNGGKPTVAPIADQVLTLPGANRQLAARKTQPSPVAQLQDALTAPTRDQIALPPAADKAVDNAKRGLAGALGIPVPPKSAGAEQTHNVVRSYGPRTHNVTKRPVTVR
ncbi:MAG: hypothetical protein QM728_14335 [Gordonia sp. (in: high G+C Gram-positive bacteria)]|uniref:hypothetical protein n=1 Tax=Gordonia sp. (in: high G+C Gram-positive bacteria) TaxID=84139 RepID=UPI0039E35E29